MDIIKEQLQGSPTRVIRTDHYSKSLGYYLRLAAIAKQDFPELEDEDIRCETFGGRMYSGTRGIEFDAPSPTPEDYDYIEYLEFTK